MNDANGIELQEFVAKVNAALPVPSDLTPYKVDASEVDDANVLRIATKNYFYEHVVYLTVTKKADGSLLIDISAEYNSGIGDYDESVGYLATSWEEAINDVIQDQRECRDWESNL